MAEMSKWERVEAAVAQQPTDRLPWSLWRHFYDQETSAADLAAAMLRWQGDHDFDLLKVNPRAQYHAEAWGARFRYSHRPTVKPVLERAVVRDPGDWERLGVRPPSAPALDEQRQALARIGRGLRGQVPFVETVFSPLGVAGYLVDDEVTLLQHLREYPNQVKAGLDAIAETFTTFVQEVLDAGADGIFFATTSWATTEMLTEAEYDEFGRPFDLRVLAAAAEARLNVLHVCRSHNMLRRLLDYPVQVLHWAVGADGNPTLEEIAESMSGKGRAVSGGLTDAALLSPDPGPALRQAKDAAGQARGRGLILAGECSIPVTSSPGTIDALHRWILQG